MKLNLEEHVAVRNQRRKAGRVLGKGKAGARAWGLGEAAWGPGSKQNSITRRQRLAGEVGGVAGAGWRDIQVDRGPGDGGVQAVAQIADFGVWE